MQITPIPGPFGVTVTGLDLAADMSEATMRELIGLLHQHQILAIKGQTLGNADYVRFSHFWGEPVIFPRKSYTHGEFRELIRVDNLASTRERDRGVTVHWHSDSTYEPVPASVTMLYGQEAPDVGGETLFANSSWAYDGLSDEMKQRIDGMTALHCLAGSPPLPGEKMPFNYPEMIAQLGINKHPLALRHPVTGRRAIYLSATAFGVEGMDPDEGKALVNELRAHAVQPQYQTRYKIEAGDILLWDNFQTMHSATPIEYSDEPGKRRLIYRISVRGLPPLCATSKAA
jgi:taurine dioxygenase